MEVPALKDMQFNPLSPPQSMRLLASDLRRIDIAQLDPEALGNIKQLSVSLTLVSTPELPQELSWFVFQVQAHSLYLQPSFPPVDFDDVILTW